MEEQSEQKTDPAQIQKPAEESGESPGGMGFYLVVALVVAVLIGFAIYQSGANTTSEDKFAPIRQKFDMAKKAIDALDFAQALSVLNQTETEINNSKEPGAKDKFTPLLNEYIGHCYFESGEARKAIEPIQKALGIYETTGEVDGIMSNLGTLFEIQRYLGESEKAAELAEKMAGVLIKANKTALAHHFEREAKILRAGEPLLRIVVIADGRTLELDELANLKAKTLRFQMERNRRELPPSIALKTKGDHLGGAGKYEEALAAFQAASKADPYNPAPVFQEAVTDIYLKKYPEAVKAYEAVEKLAPGFHTVRADKWLAERLVEGKVTLDTFKVLRTLDMALLPPEKKLELAKAQMTAQPNFAPLELAYGTLLASLKKNDEAEAVLRKGLEHVEEADTKSRLLVQLAMTVKPSEEREKLLKQAIELNGNLKATAMATLSLAKVQSTDAQPANHPGENEAKESPRKDATSPANVPSKDAGK